MGCQSDEKIANEVATSAGAGYHRPHKVGLTTRFSWGYDFNQRAASRVGHATRENDEGAE